MNLIKSQFVIQTLESSLPVGLVALSELARSRSDWIGRLANVIPADSLKFTILTCIVYNTLSAMTRPQKDPKTGEYPENCFFTPNTVGPKEGDTMADQCAAEHFIMLTCSAIVVSCVSPYLNLGVLKDPAEQDSTFLLKCSIVIGVCSAFFGHMRTERIELPPEFRTTTSSTPPQRRATITSGNTGNPTSLIDDSQLRAEEGNDSDAPSELMFNGKRPLELVESKRNTPGRAKIVENELDGPPSPTGHESPFAGLTFDSKPERKEETKSDDEDNTAELFKLLDRGSTGGKVNGKKANTSKKTNGSLSSHESPPVSPSALSLIRPPSPITKKSKTAETDEKRSGLITNEKEKKPVHHIEIASPTLSVTPVASPAVAKTEPTTPNTTASINTSASSRRKKKKGKVKN